MTKERSPQLRPGRLIVLEGIDGIGKTTLARYIAEHLRQNAMEFCSRKEIARNDEHFEAAMSRVAELLWPPVPTAFDHLMPIHYWIHLQAAWYSLFGDCILRPRLSEGRSLIVDGFFYRFVAKLLARGFDAEYLETVFSHAYRPDTVILLRANPEAVFARRNDFRPHELGLHHTRGALGCESFVAYQSMVQDVLEKMAERRRWIVGDLDLSASVADNAQWLMTLIDLDPESRGNSEEPSTAL